MRGDAVVLTTPPPGDPPLHRAAGAVSGQQHWGLCMEQDQWHRTLVPPTGHW